MTKPVGVCPNCRMGRCICAAPVSVPAQKPPCLYPLPDGRRCCECAACHAEGPVQPSHAEDARLPFLLKRVADLERQVEYLMDKDRETLT